MEMVPGSRYPGDKCNTHDSPDGGYCVIHLKHIFSKPNWLGMIIASVARAA